MGNEESLDFHTSGWMLMTLDMTSVSERDKKWIPSKFVSSE